MFEDWFLRLLFNEWLAPFETCLFTSTHRLFYQKRCFVSVIDYQYGWIFGSNDPTNQYISSNFRPLSFFKYFDTLTHVEYLALKIGSLGTGMYTIQNRNQYLISSIHWNKKNPKRFFLKIITPYFDNGRLDGSSIVYYSGSVQISNTDLYGFGQYKMKKALYFFNANLFTTLKVYEGAWKNFQPDGGGALKDGYTSFMGDWRKGKKHGKGIFQSEDSKYKGSWQNDKKEGFGEWSHALGHRYIGWWKNDFFHGYGELTFANGSGYRGLWINGKKEGFGHIFLGSDDIQEAFFTNDLLDPLLFYRFVRFCCNLHTKFTNVLVFLTLVVMATAFIPEALRGIAAVILIYGGTSLTMRFRTSRRFRDVLLRKVIV